MPTLTVSDVAQRAGVRRQAVQQWVERGLLSHDARRTVKAPDGRVLEYHFKEEEVTRFLEQRQQLSKHGRRRARVED